MLCSVWFVCKVCVEYRVLALYYVKYMRHTHHHGVLTYETPPFSLKNVSAKNMGDIGEVQLTRREREAVEEQVAARANLKAIAKGETPESAEDLARLKAVQERRAEARAAKEKAAAEKEAEKKRKEEQKEEEKANRKKNKKDKKKKKKVESSEEEAEFEELDPIAIKKMKVRREREREREKERNDSHSTAHFPILHSLSVCSWCVRSDSRNVPFITNDTENKSS